jgi:hypothetical protein
METNSSAADIYFQVVSDDNLYLAAVQNLEQTQP